jgi:hypothetical protein
MTIARQRLAKHVPESYAVNKNRSQLLDNGFGYHGIRSEDNNSTGTLEGRDFYTVLLKL